MTALLGCIADDFTGGTDLAGMLVKHGMRTVQMIGVPRGPPPGNAEAIVVALKSRTAPAAEAVAESLAALEWLRAAGCRQFYFKYCSTFDSTPAGNIGPVAEALMAALDTTFTIACPAFPVNRRTIYQGHLFVGEALLSESGMQHHPLTPMTDANLLRVLQQQARAKVGLVPYADVARGTNAIAERCARLYLKGCRLAVVDALFDTDLETIGKACDGLPLVTAGSGLAIGIARNFRDAGLLPEDAADTLPAARGARAVISGSCSLATQGQVAAARERFPSLAVDPLALARGADVAGAAVAWAAERLGETPVLIYATAPAEEVKAVQASLGAQRAGALVEDALARVAQGLAARGVRQLIVAGGETSGAVVRALGVTGLRIGPEIDPGVPWTAALHEGDAPPLALALKSGNFGTPDFFLKAWERLP